MNVEEARFTEEEQRAFDEIGRVFPDARQEGPFEPAHRDVLAETEWLLDEEEGFHLVPLDFERVLADGIPETEYLEFPYVPAGVRLWAFGPAESATRSSWRCDTAG